MSLVIFVALGRIELLNISDVRALVLFCKSYRIRLFEECLNFVPVERLNDVVISYDLVPFMYFISNTYNLFIRMTIIQ